MVRYHKQEMSNTKVVTLMPSGDSKHLSTDHTIISKLIYNLIYGLSRLLYLHCRQLCYIVMVAFENVLFILVSCNEEKSLDGISLPWRKTHSKIG